MYRADYAISALLLEKLHEEGHSREALEDALRKIPMVCY